VKRPLSPDSTTNRFRTGLRRCALLLACLLSSSVAGRADDAVPASPQLRWWKGNLHTHTLWSDGNDFPEMVAEWYRTHDYNFLALSDHNILSEGMRWMPASQIVKRGGNEVIPKYLARFGPHWVESRGTPGADNYEFRLKPLDEFRALVEDRGQFIMLVGEEISDSVQGAPVHMNATNLKELLQPLGGPTVSDAIRANLRAAEDQATRLGREILVHLNHPNFHYGVTAADMAAVLEERFFEVYNGHPGVNQLGDQDHPSVERIWDLANALRIAHWKAAPLFGVATDDSHAYHGNEGASPGRGWIMVRARHLTPESLIRAMKQADFYATSGVQLQSIVWNSAAQTLTVHVDPRPGDTYQIDFIGTRATPAADAAAHDGRPLLDSAAIGVRLDSQTGISASYRLQPNELYVRAVISSSALHPNPSLPDQRQQAWTQPFGWEKSVD
jgi:hypothetical protein